MKLFVDENIPLQTVEELHKSGHDVLDIRGTTEEGLSDSGIWVLVQREGRLLITTDKGFAQHRNETHHGIIIVRLKQPSRIKIHQRVMQAIEYFSENEWQGRMIVMRDNVKSIWTARIEG